MWGIGRARRTPPTRALHLQIIRLRDIQQIIALRDFEREALVVLVDEGYMEPADVLVLHRRGVERGKVDSSPGLGLWTCPWVRGVVREKCRAGARRRVGVRRRGRRSRGRRRRAGMVCGGGGRCGCAVGELVVDAKI